MATTYGKAQSNNPGFASDGTDVQWRMLRDGTGLVVPYIQAMILAGRGYGVNIGSQTTPITGHVAYDQDQPEAAIRVPDATAIIPFFVMLEQEASAGTVNEIVLTIVQNDIGNGTSSAATAGPLNLRTDAPQSSNCVARQAYTANSSALTNPLELARAIDATDTFLWEPQGAVPVLMGPATLTLHASATTTAPTFFAQILWIELPETAVA